MAAVASLADLYKGGSGPARPGSDGVDNDPAEASGAPLHHAAFQPPSQWLKRVEAAAVDGAESLGRCVTWLVGWLVGRCVIWLVAYKLSL